MSKKSFIYGTLALSALVLGGYGYAVYDSSIVRTSGWQSAALPEDMSLIRSSQQTSFVGLDDERKPTFNAPEPQVDVEPVREIIEGPPSPAPSPDLETVSTTRMTPVDSDVDQHMADLWSLYEQGDLSEISARIAKIKGETPSWDPSEEFQKKRDLLMETERLLNAFSVSQHETVLAIVKKNPEVLTCDRLDTLWAATVSVYHGMSAAEGLDMFERNMNGCVSDKAQRYDFALRTGEFMSRSDVEKLSKEIGDPDLDDAFAEALINADISILAEWLNDAEAPRYVRPGDEDVRQTSGDVEMRTGELRPIPGGSVYFQEVSTTSSAENTKQLMSTFGEGAAVDGAYVSTSEISEEVSKARERLADSAEGLSATPLMTLAWFDYTSGNPRSAAGLFEEARLYTEAELTALQGEVLSRLAYEDYVTAEALFPQFVKGWETNEIYLIAAAHLVAHADRDPQDILHRDGIFLNDLQAERIGKSALMTRDWDLSEKLGWHSHRLAGCEPALPWWRIARESNDDLEPAAFGIAMCLSGNTETAEMSSIRERWSDESPRIAMIFGDYQYTALAERPAKRPYAKAESAAMTGEGEQAEGDPSGPTVLTKDRAGRMGVKAVENTAEHVANEQPAPSSPARASAPAPVRSRSAAPAPVASSVRTTRSNVDPCDPRVPLADLTAQQALQRGWCLMEQNNGAAATVAFSAAARSGNASVRADAAYGESLKHLREGDYMDAQEALLKENQSPQRRREISAGILSAQAVANNRRGDPRVTLEALDRRQEFAQEPPNLMTLRGWALWRINKKTEARRIWNQAAELGDDNAKKALREAGR